jgi:succinate dehydrogenase / fumarate reductase flavoprotein subunit
MTMDMCVGEAALAEPVRLHTAVVGSGAAGWNAAGRLAALGVPAVAVVTESRTAGTSRNTGSDKQTYYKLDLSGDSPDSVYDIARTLFEGGATDGDTALAEAASSARCFFHLVELGVPFPYDRYGRYAGYKTDHDPARRAASCGPYTSRIMTECLEREAVSRGAAVLDGLRVVRVLTRAGRAAGLLTLDRAALSGGRVRYVPILCRNIVWATGGPAGLYGASVYPESQWGGTGTALMAGAAGQNLTEWQYGLASIRPRWNVSGTYQQALPRYLSTDPAGGDPCEFLTDVFRDPGELLTAVFMKGYEWPFSADRVGPGGSSLVDLAVYREIHGRGRRVWLDFTANPLGLSADRLLALLKEEAREYLARSEACAGAPIDRLARMNPGAVALYRDKGVDLAVEPLEIAVCAQHHNGGLAADCWNRSNLKNFYPVGEACGSHGVRRPGGCALNAGQTGSMRAAIQIAALHGDRGPACRITEPIRRQIGQALALGDAFGRGGSRPADDWIARIHARMDAAAAFIRSGPAVSEALRETLRDRAAFAAGVAVETPGDLLTAWLAWDMLAAQAAVLTAMDDYIRRGGGSRGSALVVGGDGCEAIPGFPEHRMMPVDASLDGRVQQVSLWEDSFTVAWRDVRPLPPRDTWFETVWAGYRQGDSFR